MALVNADDTHSAVMNFWNTRAGNARSGAQYLPTTTHVVEKPLTGLHLNIDGHDVYTRLVGAFKRGNLLAVYAAPWCWRAMDVPAAHGAPGAQSTSGSRPVVAPPGGAPDADGVLGIVDYAHAGCAEERA